MINPIFLGKTRRATKVYLSPDNVNSNVSITGISGMGKTTLQLLLEIEIVKQKGTVVGLNHDGAHDLDKLNATLRDKLMPYYHKIDIESQGIPLGLWPKKDSFSLSSERVIDRVFDLIVSSLSSESKLGARQRQNLRSCLELAFVIYRNSSACDHFECIREAIETVNDISLQERLYYLLHRVKVIPESVDYPVDVIMPEKVNVLNVSDYGTEVRDLILGLIWINMKDIYSENSPELYVVLDEYQDLNFRPNSPIQMMLRKGRKYHLGLVLTTQTQATFTSASKVVLENAATQIYFRQVAKEAVEIANFLGYTNADRSEWCRILKNLGKGEFIVKARLMKGGRVFETPIRLSNQF